MSQKDTLLGKQIDDFKLEKILGQGGMARVYRAVDTKLRRYVAIKVIDTQFREDEEYSRRFEREAQAIARFEHTNVVSVYRYGNVDGVLYMAMQYVKGSDLAQLLDDYRADDEFMTSDEVLRIMREAGRGLDYVHQQGAIHRDIKPANIMLNEEGTAIIADFGLALVQDVGTRGEIFGTPHYMSPEQAVSSAKVVPQSDVYSMGVILYEMFTHRLPFETGEPLDVAMAHLSDEPPSPRTHRPDLPVTIEKVILKSLAKEAQTRYQTCRELTDALEAAIKQTHQAHQSTMPRHSIVERVHLDLEANPLPALPSSTAQMPAVGTPRKSDPSLFERISTQKKGQAKTDLASGTGTPPTVKAKKPKRKKEGRSMLPFVATIAVVTIVAIIALFFMMNSGVSDSEATNTAVVMTNEAFIVQMTQATGDDSTQVTQQATVNVQETALADANATATAIAQQAQQAADSGATQQVINAQETAIAQQAQDAANSEATQQAINAQAAALANTNATGTAIAQQAQDTANSEATQQAINAQAAALADANATGTAIVQQATSIALDVANTAAANAQATTIAQLTQSASSVVQPTAVPSAGQTIPIIIYTRRDRALRIVRPAEGNITTPLNLSPLMLIRTDDDERMRDDNPDNDRDNPRILSGAVWIEYSPLMVGQCVDALKRELESPIIDSISCDDQGDYIAVDDENKAWDKDFNVYYNDILLATCENEVECRVEIPVGG